MSSRIENKFKQLKVQKKKAFIAYLTAGYPSLELTEELTVALADAGVDLVELGIPFSDPMADGLTIQASSQRALENGVTLEQIFNTVSRIRKRTDLPLAFMTYYNPVFHHGEENFIRRSKECGVDGLIIPDLPPEEAVSLRKKARQADLATIFFLAPTTSRKRMPLICEASTGFIYYVSLTGVTGERQKLDESLWDNIRLAKKLTDQPICIGFGISTPEQVRQAGRLADGIIVGSAIIKEIERNVGRPDGTAKVADFVRTLSMSLKEVSA